MIMTTASSLRVRVFADGANLEEMVRLTEDPGVKGFTTNPTLMRQSGIRNYSDFAGLVLRTIVDSPSPSRCSPITPPRSTTGPRDRGLGRERVRQGADHQHRGQPLAEIIAGLSQGRQGKRHRGLHAGTGVARVPGTAGKAAPSVVSVFAGRIADAGLDPVPHMRAACPSAAAMDERIDLLWASPREILNVVQADEIGVDIITVTEAIRTKTAPARQGPAGVQPRDGAHVQAGQRSRGVSTMSDFTRLYLDETRRDPGADRPGVIERLAAWAGRRPQPRGAAVHPRRRRLGGARQPRGQRLPQDCRFEAYSPGDNVSELTARDQ